MVYGCPNPINVYGCPTPIDVYGSPTPISVYGCPTPINVYGSPTPISFYGCPTPISVYGCPTPINVYGSPTPINFYGYSAPINEFTHSEGDKPSVALSQMYFHDSESRTEFFRTADQHSLNPTKPEMSRENVGVSLSIEFLSKALDLMLQKRIIFFCVGKAHDYLLLYTYTSFEFNNKYRNIFYQ